MIPLLPDHPWYERPAPPPPMPNTIRELDALALLPPHEVGPRNVSTPVVDPCPLCGAFRMDAGYYFFCGSCDVCALDGHEY